MSAINFKWIPTSTHSCQYLESRAVTAGYEAHDRSPIYIGRAYHAGDLLPCKVIPRHRAAYVAYGGKEVPVSNFEMYCQEILKVEWVTCSNGQVSNGAVPVGKTSNGETLYAGRVHHKGSLTPGKIHPSHRCCYISFGGKEIPHNTYEVMIHRYEN